MRFQVIKGRVTARAEAGLAALALQGLDVFSYPALSVSDQCMNCFIGNAKVVTVGSRTGMALGSDSLLTSSVALAVRPGLDIALDGSNSQLQS